jgi:hypothetical protein
MTYSIIISTSVANINKMFIFGVCFLLYQHQQAAKVYPLPELNYITPFAVVFTWNGHCHPIVLPVFFDVYSLFYLLKSKINVKNILLASKTSRIGKNNQRFVKDCFVIRWIVKMFYRDVPEKNGRNDQQRTEPAILRCDQWVWPLQGDFILRILR